MSNLQITLLFHEIASRNIVAFSSLRLSRRSTRVGGLPFAVIESEDQIKRVPALSKPLAAKIYPAVSTVCYDPRIRQDPSRVRAKESNSFDLPIGCVRQSRSSRKLQGESSDRQPYLGAWTTHGLTGFGVICGAARIEQLYLSDNFNTAGADVPDTCPYNGTEKSSVFRGNIVFRLT